MTTSPNDGDPMPRYTVLRGALALSHIEAIRERCDRGIAVAAAEIGRSQTNPDALVSAWSYGSEFVRASVLELRAELLAAAGRSGASWIDPGDATDASLFVASHHHEGGTHAHQDIAYRWNRPVADRYAFTTWLPLDTCDEDSGALCFADGIRRLPVLVRQDFLRRDFIDIATTPRWRERESVVAAAPGDIVIFDACTWHASKGFRAPGRRSALAIRWSSRIRWECELSVPRPEASLDVFGMDTSGGILCEAIRRALGVSAMPDGRDRLQRALALLLHARSDLLERLPSTARRSLQELEVALDLQQRGARPAARVWRQVRDNALPALNAVARKEFAHDLA